MVQSKFILPEARSLRPATEVAVLEDANKKEHYYEVCYLHYNNGKFINTERKKICSSYCYTVLSSLAGKENYRILRQSNYNNIRLSSFLSPPKTRALNPKLFFLRNVTSQ